MRSKLQALVLQAISWWPINTFWSLFLALGCNWRTVGYKSGPSSNIMKSRPVGSYDNAEVLANNFSLTLDWAGASHRGWCVGSGQTSAKPLDRAFLSNQVKSCSRNIISVAFTLSHSSFAEVRRFRSCTHCTERYSTDSIVICVRHSVTKEGDNVYRLGGWDRDWKDRASWPARDSARWHTECETNLRVRGRIPFVSRASLVVPNHSDLDELRGSSSFSSSNTQVHRVRRPRSPSSVCPPPLHGLFFWNRTCWVSFKPDVQIRTAAVNCPAVHQCLGSAEPRPGEYYVASCE